MSAPVSIVEPAAYVDLDFGAKRDLVLPEERIGSHGEVVFSNDVKLRDRWLGFLERLKTDRRREKVTAIGGAIGVIVVVLIFVAQQQDVSHAQ